jgi:hypothetical protein
MHQIFIALWQLFPIWVGLCQFVLSNMIASSIKKSNSRELLERIYASAVILTLVINISTVTLIASSHSLEFGSLFQNTVLQKMLSIFIPVPVAEKVGLDNLGKGCLSLLQYDMYFACGASLLWTFSLWKGVCNRPVSFLSILKLLCATVILGPGGASLLVMWQRDERLLKARVESTAKQAKE